MRPRLLAPMGAPPAAYLRLAQRAEGLQDLVLQQVPEARPCLPRRPLLLLVHQDVQHLLEAPGDVGLLGGGALVCGVRGGDTRFLGVPPRAPQALNSLLQKGSDARWQCEEDGDPAAPEVAASARGLASCRRPPGAAGAVPGGKREG